MGKALSTEGRCAACHWEPEPKQSKEGILEEGNTKTRCASLG